ncbi:NADH-ubiquinone oxidoreductase [Lepidopterella palustris CBS 459.81]|uniref:NADH-ubiquinone oxidoreductase n=1 Tax=Lepidopterella palustris CBS 459.81 TaxID=1314670 RepID=A0A8E2E2C1_9PEZI|nr:NADH-ubiquinone oxidoreductase [Lepidopterella palustris CBS 459.81]
MIISTLRARTPLLLSRASVRTAAISTSVNQIPANDPNPKAPKPNVSATNAAPTSSEGSFDQILQESVEKGEELRVMQAPNRQAPNRKGVWSRNQQLREVAMTGPRFEQTIMEDQPRPYSAIELIHKQPVRWTTERVVACDGGGGPLGHPKIFINVDKPQICWCTYCGLPFAHEHHRKHLESLPSTSYPLAPTGDPAEVPVSQRITNEPLGQR